jgi:hypothetical protein
MRSLRALVVCASLASFAYADPSTTAAPAKTGWGAKLKSAASGSLSGLKSGLKSATSASLSKLKATGSLLSQPRELLSKAGSSLTRNFSVRGDVREAATMAKEQAKAGNFKEAAQLLVKQEGMGWRERRMLKKAEKSVIKEGKRTMKGLLMLGSQGDTDVVEGVGILAKNGNRKAQKAIGKYAGRTYRLGLVSARQGDVGGAMGRVLAANKALEDNEGAIKMRRSDKKIGQRLNQLLVKDIANYKVQVAEQEKLKAQQEKMEARRKQALARRRAARQAAKAGKKLDVTFQSDIKVDPSK